LFVGESGSLIDTISGLLAYAGTIILVSLSSPSSSNGISSSSTSGFSSTGIDSITSCSTRSGTSSSSPEEENGDNAEFEQNVDEDVKYPTFGTAFEATEWAEENNEVVRISYTTKHGRFLIRDVEPHGKFHSQSTHKEILVTWDETVGDIRAFIVSNISKWAFVKKKFNKKFTVKV
jgi:hypothetical protein